MSRRRTGIVTLAAAGITALLLTGVAAASPMGGGMGGLATGTPMMGGGATTTVTAPATGTTTLPGLAGGMGRGTIGTCDRSLPGECGAALEGSVEPSTRPRPRRGVQTGFGSRPRALDGLEAARRNTRRQRRHPPPLHPRCVGRPRVPGRAVRRQPHLLGHLRRPERAQVRRPDPRLRGPWHLGRSAEFHGGYQTHSAAHGGAAPPGS